MSNYPPIFFICDIQFEEFKDSMHQKLMAGQEQWGQSRGGQLQEKYTRL